MNKENKKSLIKRAVLRTAFATGSVVALSAIYTPLITLYMTLGYGYVLFSMEHTAKRMIEKEKENEKDMAEEMKKKIVAYYKYGEPEKQISIIEEIEKVEDKIFNKQKKFNELISERKNKKTQIIFKQNMKALKQQKNESEYDSENQLNR